MDSAAPDAGQAEAGDGASLHASSHGHHGHHHPGGIGVARPASPAPGQQQAARAWNKIVRAVLQQTESEAAATASAASGGAGGGVELAALHTPAMAQEVWSTLHSGTPHARKRSASFASRAQQNLLQLARSAAATAAAATPAASTAAPSTSHDWHVTFHHDESESESSEVRGAADEERKSKEAGAAMMGTATPPFAPFTPPFGARRPPALPIPFSPIHQRNAMGPAAVAGSSSIASTGSSVAPSAGTPVAAAALRRPSFSAASPSHILRKHDPAPLAALNFLPGGLNAAAALEQYPSLTPADLEDIGSFLDAHADDRWNYSSLFSWSEAKLALLLQAIQPEHLTLIAHRSMREHVTSRPIDIAFRNLWYQVEEHGELVAKLRGLSGYCKPGMMVCVWGAADSGVSTFLALLAGCFQRASSSSSQVTGELLLNGQPLLHQLSALRSARPQLGYVTREAENFALLTVSQTIYFSARLRLPKLPETILRFRVGLVCKLLGLSHLQDSIVGSATVRGLSGGERRRLGYACELVVGYSLILCDQPTDGLDQPTALALMQNFKLTCGAGRSMMTSLASASTELFELFDFILLLSKGACIYFGPRKCVMEYLASQGFEPPRAEEIVMPGNGALADGDFDLEAGKEAAPSLLAVPDFLQSLSATPERFWRAKLPIAVRDRPVPWLSEAFPFFSNAAAISSSSKQAKEAAAAAAKYLIEVDVRRLTRMDSDHTDSPQMSTRNNLAAASAAAAVASGAEMTPVKRQLSSHALSLDPPASAAATAVAASSALMVSQPTRRRAWKRLLKGWRASDLNADCAYVLDFDLQPIQPALIKQNNSTMPGPEAAAAAAPHLPRKPAFLPERPSFLTQLWLCLVRQSSFVYRNRGLWLYNYLKTLVLALVMGTLFFQLGRDAQRDVRPRFGAFYFAITFYGNAAIQMISVLLSSRSIVLWEAFAGYYHSMAYSLALTLVFIPVALVEMLLFSIVFYPLAGLADGVASVSFLYFWMVFTLSNLAGRGWILLFTTFLPTQSLANIAAPVFNLLVSSFCGYLHPASSIPAAWKPMYYLSYYTYAFRGLSMNEFEGLSFECPGAGGGGVVQASCSVVSGADALALYDINYSDPGSQKWRDLLILFAFWVAFQSLAALALLTRHYQPRGEPIQPDWGEGAANATMGSEKGGRAATATKEAANVPEQAPLLLGPSAASAAVPLLPGRAGSPDNSPAPRHVLSFLHLSYSVPLPPPRSGAAAAAAAGASPSEKLLLDDMCGVVCVGQLVALMGTSGAGKSTLLDVLAQKKTSGRISGSIQWDGRPLPAHFERLMGYVEQFDSLAPNSTVQESLFFAGRLRLPVTLSDDEIHARVQRLLRTLELEPMRDSLIGSAENGNLLPPEIRKKVSIGIELMNDPQLLFLDEPTTGLNSIEALLIARLLKTLSRRLVVIATIHQPSNAVLAHFDALLLVKPPGQLAFYGSFASAAKFFQELPTHYPSQLSDVHFPVLQPHDNLADVVLGALKTVAKREGEAKIRNVSTAGGDSSGSGPGSDGGNARLRSFHCREAFLQSPYALPLLRALSQEHGKDEVAQFAASHGVENSAVLLDAPPLPASVTAGWSFDPASFVVNVPASKSAVPSPSSSPPTASSSASQASSQSDVSALLYWYRFRELFSRFVLSTLRAKRQFRLRFFTCCFYGAVTGTLFWQLGLDQKAAVSRLSFIYFTARFSLFSGNLKLPGVFGVRVLTARESGAGMYSQGFYALTRSIADLPWVLLEMFCFTTIVYWSAGMSDAKDGALYAWSLLVLTLDRLISIGFIELVGALSSTIEMAQSVQTGANMLFMLFSGFFIAPSAIPRGWRWMQYLSPYFYVIRFLATNEYKTLSEFTCDAEQRVEIPAGYTTCPVSADMARLGTKCPLQCGAEVLAIYSIPNDADSGYRYEDLGIVLLFALAYPILAAVALRSVNWIRR